MSVINKIPKGIKSIKGLSTKQILNMDVYSLNTKSLREVTRRLVSSANKRLRRLYDKAPYSPALRNHIDDLNKTLKPFSIKGLKTRNQVESLMKELRTFLNADTSTIKGFKQYEEEIKNRIGEFESENQKKDFWKNYNEWKAKNPNKFNRFNDTNTLISMFYDNYVVKGLSSKGTKSNITKAVNKKLKEDVDKYNKVEERLKNDLKNVNAFKFEDF